MEKSYGFPLQHQLLKPGRGKSFGKSVRKQEAEHYVLGKMGHVARSEITEYSGPFIIERSQPGYY